MPGKPSVAMNLATQLAQGGNKVVLVEADLRQATRRKVGDGSTSSGLAGLLVNQLRTAGGAVVHTLEPKLKVLPAGTAAGTPSTLLRSPRLPLVVDQLRALADHVVFDLPSVVAWEEALHLVRLADMTLLVVENGKTSREAAKQAADRLKEANQGTLGVVLTRAPAWLSAPREPEAPVTPAAPAPVPAAAMVAAPVAAPASERLELAVDELLAELEDALRLIRAIRRPGERAELAQPDAGLAAIDR
jgi:capsular exopolysaccharide synthesis family protein